MRLPRVVFLALALSVPEMACEAREKGSPVLRCVWDTIDQNKDGNLTSVEIERELDRSLSWWEKKVLQTMDGVGKIFQKCDLDEDETLSYSEGTGCFLHSEYLNTIASHLNCADAFGAP